MTVAELLQRSREAHLRYRQNAGKIDRLGKVLTFPDDVAARAAIIDALTYRREATELDPDATDPDWAEDASLHRGQSSETMLKFYRDYLA